ncbi:hypothetical protein [Geobacter sp.]|uniref:hypothetical protein n=1 Tax=Geobacter sp. TaxID=46610 RepID=UPI0026282C39|nr:hypothetical protein [Geobacter sp.]
MGTNHPFEGATPETVVSHLTEMARIDPLFRDLYLERGRDLLSPLLPHDAYLHLKKGAVLLEESLRQSRTAVEHGDWETLRRLAAQIAFMRRELNEKHSLLELGNQVYDPPPVVPDLFSPGIWGILGSGGESRADLRDKALELLAALAAEGDNEREFYGARRSHFLSLVVDGSEGVGAKGIGRDPKTVKEEMIRALENGDEALVESLLQAMAEPDAATAERAERPATAARTPEDRWGSELATPFPADAVKRAQRFGLAPARLAPALEVSECLYWAAHYPMHFEPSSLRDGGARIHVPLPPPAESFSQALREKIELFSLHPFVTSSGGRYLPYMVEEEVLVEEFAEGGEEDPPSSLVATLGFDRRRALSRLELELSLLERGPSMLRDELGLDPREFRLICIPHDVYCRLGQRYGWGKQQLWTHFDGYQVLKEGRFRALVGGDVRFGGLQDLCGIGIDDERDGVLARFTVVRRSRLVAAQRAPFLAASQSCRLGETQASTSD